jgi:hypothetical protein
VLLACTQPVAGLQLSFVHGLLSLQFGDEPPLQVPPLHTSMEVHAFPSLHGATLFVCKQPVAGSQLSSVQELPSVQRAALSVWTQPVAGLQLSSVHRLLSLHDTAFPGLQVPPPHVSPVVQALPSSHALMLLA